MDDLSLAVDHQYVEYSCSRPLNDNAFMGGLQDFNFSIGRPNVAFMDKSYMRFELEVKGAGGAAPKVWEQIALAEGCIANMYGNVAFKAAKQEISKIDSFFAQVSAVERRTSNSGAWLDRIGAYTYGYNGDRSSRVAALSATVNASQVGIPLNEGKSEIYRPTDGKTPADATVALAATGAVTGVGTAFAASDIGSDIVIAGSRFQISTYGGPTAVTVVATAGNPVIPATSDWYLCRRNLSGALQARNTIQVLWKPSALGIFRWGEPLGSGEYQLSLVPDPNYKMTAVEFPYSATTNYGPLNPAAATYSITVKDAKLYVAIAKMNIPDRVSELHLTEFACYSRAMTSSSGNFTWNVPSSTKAIYMFLQDLSSGSNPIIPPSVFRVYGTSAAPGTVLPTGIGQEQKLTQLQINYANITKPQSRWITSLSSVGGSNVLVQNYMQSLIENGLIDSRGGAETMDQWLQRGPLYCWRFERDSQDRSTEVQTLINYDSTGWQQANIFLCAEFTRVVELTTTNGNITNVRSLNI